MSVAALLNKTCTLVAKAHSIDSTTGGNKQTESTTTGVPCAVQVASGSQAMRMSAESGITEYDCYFKSTQTVLVGYRMESVTGITGTFSITSVSLDDAGRSAYVRATARLVSAEESQR